MKGIIKQVKSRAMGSSNGMMELAIRALLMIIILKETADMCNFLLPDFL